MTLNYRLVWLVVFAFGLMLIWGLHIRQVKRGQKEQPAAAATNLVSRVISTKNQTNSILAAIPVMTRPNDALEAEILSLLATGNPLDHSRVYRELLPDLVRRDPLAAAAFAQSAAANAWHDDLMVTVAQVWTDLDVDKAEQWATQLPNPTERNMALGYFCFEEANVNAGRAVQVLDNEALSSSRREIIVANLAQQWAQQDLALLYQQLDKLPAGAERDVLFKQVSVAQAQADPQTAARMAAEKISAGPDQNEAVLLILRQWAKKDMAAAVAWSNQFPDEQLRGQAKVLLSGNLYGAYLPP